jgi:GNAT superfamily N-acetyltransferase
VNSFEFRIIELPRDGDVCICFRRDAYACSFDDPQFFDRQTGGDAAYLAWLTERITEFPQGFVHVWKDGEIIGQLEMRPRVNSNVGYVNLFYLVPSMRGTGAGEALHEYVMSVFAAAGCGKLQLNVSPTNGRAVRYYRKHGWQDLGQTPTTRKFN